MSETSTWKRRMGKKKDERERERNTQSRAKKHSRRLVSRPLKRRKKKSTGLGLPRRRWEREIRTRHRREQQGQNVSRVCARNGQEVIEDHGIFLGAAIRVGHLPLPMTMSVGVSH